jgi:hypothetical protein
MVMRGHQAGRATGNWDWSSTWLPRPRDCEKERQDAIAKEVIRIAKEAVAK